MENQNGEPLVLVNTSFLSFTRPIFRFTNGHDQSACECWHRQPRQQLYCACCLTFTPAPCLTMRQVLALWRRN